MEYKMKRITFLLISTCSIFTGCVTEQQNRYVHFPIKIGLLADTQLTSHNGFYNYSQRSKFADRMVDVAIRPPALECYLAEEMLNIALKKLTQDNEGEKNGVDVIIYLGDGVNSGGTDEVELFFSVLEKHRDATGIPIFVILERFAPFPPNVFFIVKSPSPKKYTYFFISLSPYCFLRIISRLYKRGEI